MSSHCISIENLNQFLNLELSCFKNVGENDKNSIEIQEHSSGFALECSICRILFFESSYAQKPDGTAAADIAKNTYFELSHISHLVCQPEISSICIEI